MERHVFKSASYYTAGLKKNKLTHCKGKTKQSSVSQQKKQTSLHLLASLSTFACLLQPSHSARRLQADLKYLQSLLGKAISEPLVYCNLANGFRSHSLAEEVPTSKGSRGAPL